MQQNNFFQNLRAFFPSEREAQLNRLNIPNKVELGGGKSLEADDIKYIVDNTYQQNTDGTSYGVGKDGRPYSYRLNGAKVDDVASLDMENQRNLITRFTDGKIKAGDSIASPENLAWIFHSLKRMQDYGNGNLVPGRVMIEDMDKYTPEEDEDMEGIVGAAFPFVDIEGDNSMSDKVYIKDTAHPDRSIYRDNANNERGWWIADANGSGTTTHELAHTVNFAIDDAPYRRYIEDFLNVNNAKSKVQEADSATKALDRYDKASKALEGKYVTSLFDEAAKNAGYETVDKALSGYGYGSTNYTEAFAEAYTDVLYNGENALPFSKELIKSASNLADEVAKVTGVRSKKAEKLMASAREMFPLGTFLDTQDRQFERFKNNYRLAK